MNLIRKSHPTPFTARLTRIPFLGKLTNRLLFKDDEIVYIPINESIEPKENVALPSDIVRHFVKIAGHRWIMNECICRAAKKCRDHAVHLGCIFSGEAVLGINPALGRLAFVEETLEHKRGKLIIRERIAALVDPDSCLIHHMRKMAYD